MNGSAPRRGMNRAERRRAARLAGRWGNLSDAERAELAVLTRADELPLHVRDQADAAAADSRRLVKVAAALSGGSTVEVAAADLGPVGVVVSRFWRRLLGGDELRGCPHVRPDRGPMPLVVPIWSAPLAVLCATCAASTTPPFEREHRTCDACGEVGAERTTGGAIAVGMFTIDFGLCVSCFVAHQPAAVRP